MMRFLLLITTTFLASTAFCQEISPSQKIFEGYIFSEDSIPAENAHLINYRTSKISTTNSKGYFRCLLQDGDSLMINHVSLVPVVIHTSKVKEGIYTIYVPYRTYTLRAIQTGDYERLKKNAEENLQQARQDFKQIIIVKPEHRALPSQSPYDDNKLNPGITVTILRLNKPKKPEIPPEY